ncbi:MAG: NAD-dependent epimerase/dehydratase family protein [Nitrospira sp.]|nr:MAG: NAD-dependent epimerase/dehydratase family protein [Nitrospira sp.]
MIIGSGLLAHAFSREFLHCADVCIYAAGVSNSSCTNTHEFERERQRLAQAVQQALYVNTFVYFGTCSVSDPGARNTPYVQHKLAMEQLVRTHPRCLILRLPQVVGKTPNPHTLLNFLYARISRSESFELWGSAKRSIIDVEDVAAIAEQLIAINSVQNTVAYIANVVNYRMVDIVHEMERVVGKRAVYDVVERGSEYFIDTSVMLPVLEKAGVKFGNDYLEKVIDRYYK